MSSVGATGSPMGRGPAGRILVATDGSAAATAAVGVAAGLAALRDVALDVVHVVEPRLLPHQHGPDPLPDALAAALVAAPRVAARPLARTGPVISVLTDLARDYALLVLGSRGHGALVDAAVGSSALALVASATCPVVVVRPGADRPRRGGAVVVALAGSEADGSLLDFAFAEAALRGTGLIAAHGRVDHTLGVGQLVLAAFAPGSPHAPADVVARELAPWRERYPQVAVEFEVRHGRAAGAVLEAARGAELLVMGSRGRGAHAGPLLGSVSQAVLHHAHCPVVFVP